MSTYLEDYTGQVAEYLGTTSEMGRTRDRYRCPCGHVNHFYRWSVAGNGYGKCTWCKGRISWANKTWHPPTEKDRRALERDAKRSAAERAKYEEPTP